MLFLIEVRSEGVGREVGVVEECERFRKSCKEFDRWLKEREEEEKQDYTVFSI